MSRIPESAEPETEETPEVGRHDGPVYRSILLPAPPKDQNGDGNGSAAPATSHSPQSDEALAEAMKPVLRDNVMKALKDNPEVVIDIVYPVMGRVIRKSISESIKSLMTAIENSAKSAFSMKRIKWRWQAWRTGKTYQQIVLENSLVFRVEEVLLIHRRTGLLALHESLDPEHHQDRELVSGMLTAIEDFARDSFQLDDGANLSSFTFGRLELLVKASPHALLAAAVRGTPTQAVHDMLDDSLVTIHERFLRQLEHFDGDSSSLQQIRPVLRECLLSQTTE